MSMCVKAAPHGGHTHNHEAPQTSSVNRRAFLKVGAASVVGMGLAAASPAIPPLASHKSNRSVVDLTHRLVKTFPSFLGPQAVFDQVQFTIPDNGFYAKQWTFEEHTGTHVDAPGHFSLGMPLVDELDPHTLIAPLAVIDIRRKARANPNAMVEPSDLVRYERRHGRIRRGALVCINSGWAAKVGDGDVYRGGVGFPNLNFSAFGSDATDWLNVRRDIVGIGVDTMSLDPGNSADFAVHISFLGSWRGTHRTTDRRLLLRIGIRHRVGALLRDLQFVRSAGGPLRTAGWSTGDFNRTRPQRGLGCHRDHPRHLRQGCTTNR